IFVPLMVGGILAEQAGVPALTEKLGVDQQARDRQAGGNMEGKGAGFGVGNSALWAATTTPASHGSVNPMPEPATPPGRLGPVGWGGWGGAGRAWWGSPWSPSSSPA